MKGGVCLIGVEVAVLGIGVDHSESSYGASMNGAVAHGGHDYRFRTEIVACEDFVPANDAFSFAGEMFLNMGDEPVEQSHLVGESFMPDTALTFGTVFPVLCVDIVNAYVDKFAWKEQGNLVEYVVDEPDDIVVAGAECGLVWPTGT
jgi:hypothetical protein